MTGTVHATWHVSPVSPPQPQRQCSTCGRPRPFRCSGKVRLNANGRRLDAWLIYNCTVCDRTWNLPLLDRVPVADIPPADLAAMQSSNPAWVEPHAFDLTALRRHTTQVMMPADLIVRKRLVEAGKADWSRIILAIEATWPTGQRLDRLLAHELGVSRSSLATMQGSGGLCVVKGPRHAIKTPLVGSVILHFYADRIAERARLALVSAFGLPPPGRGR